MRGSKSHCSDKFAPFNGRANNILQTLTLLFRLYNLSIELGFEKASDRIVPGAKHASNYTT